MSRKLNTLVAPAYMYALTAIFLWSTVATAFKLTLQWMQPLQLLFYASIASTVILLIVIQWQHKWAALIKAAKKQWFYWLLMGLLNPLLYYWVLFKAYDLLPAQQAQSLNYTWAITLTLLSVPILGHKISRYDWGACFLGYLGVLIICTQGDLFSFELVSALGVGLAMLSTVIWALYWILNTKNQCDPVISICLCFLFGLPFVTCATALYSDVSWFGWRPLLGAFYVGAFEMGVTFVLWLLALKHAENTAKIGTLIFLSPFLSLLFIATFLGESIHPATVIGLVLIVVGLLLQRIQPKTMSKLLRYNKRVIKQDSDKALSVEMTTEKQD